MLEESQLKELRDLAFKYSLLNAVKHGGKASLNAVVSKVVGEKPSLKSFVKQLIPLISQVVEEVNRLTLNEQLNIVRSNWPELLEEKKAFEKKYLPPLPNAVEGRVVTRFAPNPDYTIHLGNARSAYLSYIYAEMYRGEMVLRFEDTDPRIKVSFPDSYVKIKEDLRWLGIKWSREYIQSLRLSIYYETAKELIKRGGAYVDKCNINLFRKLRNQGRECPHRSLDPSNHLEEFDKMIEGAYSEGEAVVRVKTDLEHPDPSVRDWVALRIIDTSRNPHPLVGDKYVVWPTYNYAAGVDDYLMGITHIFRGKEHMTNTVKQKYMYERLGWKYPEAIHFGRLSLEGVVLSKSLMRRRVREGYEVYDDIRFGTLSALRRRGIVPEAIHEVIREVGLSPLDAKISYVNLAAVNRKIIDPVAYRYMYVEDPVEVVVEGLPEEHLVKITRHPTLKTYDEVVFKGPRISIYLAKSDAETLVRRGMIRLMELANVKFVRHVNNGRTVINAMYIDNSLETAQKNDLQIVQWVPVNNCIAVEVLKPFGDSIVRSFGYAERSIERVKSGDIIQFYRYGFVRIERTSAGIRAIFAHT